MPIVLAESCALVRSVVGGETSPGGAVRLAEMPPLILVVGVAAAVLLVCAYASPSREARRLSRLAAVVVAMRLSTPRSAGFCAAGMQLRWNCDLGRPPPTPRDILFRARYICRTCGVHFPHGTAAVLLPHLR